MLRPAKSVVSESWKIKRCRGWGLNPRQTSETSRNFLKLGANLTIGKRGWRGSGTRDQLFQTWNRLENNPRNNVFESLGVEPRTNEIEAGTSNPNQKQLFKKIKITGTLTQDRRC
jgi:hypothetical protein